MKKPGRAIIAFLTGVIWGISIWLLSLKITGEKEPWDSRSWYYTAALFLGGLVCGWIAPRHRSVWLGPADIYLGQCLFIGIYSWVSPHGGVNFFIPIGMIALAIYGLASIAGALGARFLQKLTNL